MAHNTDKVGFPDLPLTGGMQLRLEAIDPTVDAAVAGVTSTRWSIYGYDQSGDPLAIPDVIPLYTPEDVGAPGEAPVSA